MPAYLDYQRKRGGLGPAIVPTGDVSRDMDRIRAFYADKVGKYPECVGPVRLREEAAGDDGDNGKLGVRVAANGPLAGRLDHAAAGGLNERVFRHPLRPRSFLPLRLGGQDLARLLIQRAVLDIPRSFDHLVPGGDVARYRVSTGPAAANARSACAASSAARAGSVACRARASENAVRPRSI